MSLLPQNTWRRQDEMDAARHAAFLASFRWLLLIAGLLLLGFLPTVAEYGINLWRRGHYQFYPLAILGAVMLARQRLLEFENLKAALSKPLPLPGIGLLAVAFGIMGGATLWWSPWLGYIAALLALTAALLLLGGAKLVRTLFPALLMLAVLVHPPLNLDRQFALHLRALAVRAGSWLLDLLAVPHFLTGTVIEIPKDRLLVEEACSGIVSVFFIVVFALFLSLWRKRHPVHFVFLALINVVFVLLGNIVRISGGTFLSYRCGFNVLTGWPHEAFGICLLAIYMALVLSTDALLLLLWSRKTAPEDSEAHNWLHAADHTTVLLTDLWTLTRDTLLGPARNKILAGAILFALLGGTQWVLAWGGYGGAVSSVLTGNWEQDLPANAAFTLPDRLGDWQRVGKDGEDQKFQTLLQFTSVHSHIWGYRKGRMLCLVALSYPYFGDHDPTDCYAGNGWELSPPIHSADPGAPGKSVVEMDMKKKPSLTGYLVYESFTSAGQKRLPNLADHLLARLTFHSNQRRQDYRKTYQTQLLAVGYSAFGPDEKHDARQLFQSAHQLLMDQVLHQLRQTRPAQPPPAAPAKP